MQIQFDRTGGFAGILRECSFSTDSMPEQECQQLTALVNSSRFFELPPVVNPPGPMADRFQYRISIHSE
ncbi:MAG: protealysin inhibitor emfourin, partial [Candidatus Acidiferrales bacterium]